MTIGQMDKYFEVQKTSLSNQGGSLESQKETLFSVWGSLSSKGESDSMTYVITMRYREDIKTGLDLVWDGRRFSVRSIFDLGEDKKYLTLYVQEENLLNG